MSRIRLIDSGGVQRLTAGPRPRGSLRRVLQGNGSPEWQLRRARGRPGRRRARSQSGSSRVPKAHDRTARKARTSARPSDPDSAKANERLLVDIWLVVDEAAPSQSDRPSSAGDKGNAAERAEETRRQWQMASRELAKQLGGAGRGCGGRQAGARRTMRLPASVIRELASHDRIGALLFHEEEGIDDLGDSIAIARSGVVHARARPVRAFESPVWENGPTSNDDLVIAARYETDPTTSDHSQQRARNHQKRGRRLTGWACPWMQPLLGE